MYIQNTKQLSSPKNYKISYFGRALKERNTVRDACFCMESYSPFSQTETMSSHCFSINSDAGSNTLMRQNLVLPILPRTYSVFVLF